MAQLDIRSILTKQIERRTSEFGRSIRTTAETLREIADRLRADDNASMLADLTEQGAETIDRAGQYIEQSDLDELLGAAQTFARRQPWAATGLGLITGVATSRLIKSTAQRRGAFGGAGGG